MHTSSCVHLHYPWIPAITSRLVCVQCPTVSMIQGTAHKASNVTRYILHNSIECSHCHMSFLCYRTLFTFILSSTVCCCSVFWPPNCNKHQLSSVQRHINFRFKGRSPGEPGFVGPPHVLNLCGPVALTPDSCLASVFLHPPSAIIKAAMPLPSGIDTRPFTMVLQCQYPKVC